MVGVLVPYIHRTNYSTNGLILIGSFTKGSFDYRAKSITHLNPIKECVVYIGRIDTQSTIHRLPASILRHHSVFCHGFGG
ncbi:hypothetical protein SEA_DAUBENSKI_244 [Streptomyces phage Daubenski]|uniref:Uncharacterized protein n=1 Tax=Streptomyces phage Daubenski TaxID=2653725 RepID=A0A5Q2WDN6_9CAUD|nr:hypothetical protein KNU80_gp061 [Streptomyces phage Daubenski]QGH76536.1 hypothetical protein SEA_DAUBENSKI_244 [Streptomyces phage Daubenski]